MNCSVEKPRKWHRNTAPLNGGFQRGDLGTVEQLTGFKGSGIQGELELLKALHDVQYTSSLLDSRI